jgi:signal transduction histidine kinase
VFSNLVEKNGSISLAMVREVSHRLRSNDAMAIEDLRLRAKELAEAYQQLAEEEYARQVFLTTIAHELRNPLMAANGYLQLIQTGAFTEEELKRNLETIANNLQQITILVNDILFIQEMDLILSDFRPLNLGIIATSAVKQQEKHANSSHIDIQLLIPPEPPIVQGDERSLERAVIATLDNAIKFSPNGGDVLVEVGSDEGTAWIKISDHGVGIPTHAQPHIFDRFFHLEEVGDFLFRGVGLGLAIAKQVIEQHHGNISFESELGKGSTFLIQIQSKE